MLCRKNGAAQTEKIQKKVDKMNYIGQLIGIAAIGVSSLIYIQKSRLKMVIMKLVTDVLWVLHHISIMSYTAAATTGIAIIREIVFLRKHKKSHEIYILIGFSALFTAAAVFTWRDCFSVFPAVGSVLSTLAFGSKEVRLIRFFAFLSSVCMMIYGIHYISIPTIINECLVQTSIIASFVQVHRNSGGTVLPDKKG